MPIVKSEQMHVDGSQFTRKVKCDSSGKFSCALPVYVSEEMGMSEDPSGGSMSECLGKWAELIKLYENRTVEQSKIIAFKFDTDISFSEGISLAVSAAVLEETVTTHRDGKKVYTYSIIDSELDYSLRQGFAKSYYGEKHDQQVPWNEKSVAFFNDLAKAMERLTSNLAGISKPEALLEFVSSGQKLLQAK